MIYFSFSSILTARLLTALQIIILILSTFCMFRPCFTMISMHFKCRGGLYPRSTIERFPVPDHKVSWATEFKEYKPQNYTAPSIHGQPWADPNIGDVNFKPQWNSIDGPVNRVSYMGEYTILNGYPLNPIGRTGITGRGVLGRWGPNHAADPVVTRWKRLATGDIEFVGIKRRDTGEWALPGGMVDPGEKVTVTAVREFQEEAMNSLNMTQDEKNAWMDRFEKFFDAGDLVYQGYIDDPRNTDNAWLESAAYNFHDDGGLTVGALALTAGDDAVGVRWLDAAPDLTLYATHRDIVFKVLEKRLSNYSA